MLDPAATICYLIGPHRISCDDENRALIIDASISIRFSPIQYKLVKPLVKSESAPLCEAALVKAAYASDNWHEMHDNLEKHFDNIRSKLRLHGLYAYCVNGYGYSLLAMPEDDNGP